MRARASSHRQDARAVRTAELATFEAAFDDLGEGQSRIVELAGDPGMGKTRLLGSVSERATRRGLAVGRATSAESDQGRAFQPFLTALGERVVHATCRELPTVTAEIVRNSLLREERGEADDNTVFSALRAAITVAAHDGLALLFDDFHWADDHSARFLAFLARNAIDAPLLIVVAHRPRQSGTLLRSALAHGVEAGSADRVQLDPLTIVQAATLLDAKPYDQELHDLHERADGNPLYLLALTAAGPDGETQEHFSLLLSRELAQPSPDAMLVAHAAAVLGCPCDVTSLTAVAELSSQRICAAVAELQRRDLLRHAEDGPTLCFRHPLLLDVAYATADPCWRNGAHRRVLAVLADRGAPATERAVHIERSLGLFQPEDVSVLAEAAVESIAHEPAAATARLRLALRLAADDEIRSRLRLSLATALVAAGELREASALLRRILRAADPLTGSFRATVAAEGALVECLLGNYAEANSLLTVEGIAAAGVDAAATVRLLVREAVVGLFAGGLPEPDRAERAYEAAQDSGDRFAVIGMLALRGLLAAYAGDVDRATALAAECATLVDTVSDVDLVGNPDHLTLLGLTERMLARFSDAERHLRRQIAIIRETAGTTCMLPIALMALSMNYQAVAWLAEARTAAAEAREAAVHLGATDVQTLATMLESAYQAWIDRSRGSLLAVATAEKAVAVRLPRDCWFGIQSALLLARILEIEQENKRCITMVLNAGGGPELPHVPPAIQPRCFEMLAAAAVNTGDPRAESWAARAVAAAETLGQPNHRGSALMARGHWLTARQEFEAAAGLYREAADLFASLGMIGAQIRALTFAARSGTLGGLSDDVLTNLVLAKDLALQCGAVVLYEDAEQQRRQLAAQAEAIGQDSGGIDLSVLTKREREIARIAGTGKRTREIAEELSLSPRTVDLHLTHVYRKLNITSRAALASLIARASQHIT